MPSDPDVLTCPMPDCDEALFMVWKHTRALYPGDEAAPSFADLGSVSSAESSTWSIECVMGHVILLPKHAHEDDSDIAFNGECYQCAPDQGEANVPVRHDDTDRLFQVLSLKASSPVAAPETTLPGQMGPTGKIKAPAPAQPGFGDEEDGLSHCTRATPRWMVEQAYQVINTRGAVLKQRGDMRQGEDYRVLVVDHGTGAPVQTIGNFEPPPHFIGTARQGAKAGEVVDIKLD